MVALGNTSVHRKVSQFSGIRDLAIEKAVSMLLQSPQVKAQSVSRECDTDSKL